MKNIESGRSMIEMLGVLAIVGVLSIGGLAGYTMAMNRWRANTLTDYTARCVVVAQTKGVTGAPDTGACQTIMSEAIPGFVTSVSLSSYNKENDETTVTVAGISSAVKTVLSDKLATRVNGVQFDGTDKFSYMNANS